MIIKEQNGYKGGKKVNVTQVVELTATYLQLEEVLEMEELGGTEVNPTELTQKNLELLVRCVNLVYQELATDYIPLKHAEEITVSSGEFLFENLTKSIINVLSLKNLDGENKKFKIYPNAIKVENGTYQIEYSYLPSEVSLGNEVEAFSGRISERILAYGVASEYSFISGLFEEASMWKKRFEDAVLIASRKKSPLRMPTRRWV